MSDFVEARFEKLRNESDGDWNDVLQRVRRRGRRRRLTVVGAAAIGVLVVVPTALALRTTITDFFQSEPAPARVVLEFERQDAGAPPHLANRVIYGQTRKVLEGKLTKGGRLTLWAAPNRRGGYCMALDGPSHPGEVGCLWRGQAAPVAVGIEARAMTRDGDITKGPALVWGTVTVDKAETIELHYQDGAVESQPLTWVSKPIDAAFFLFEIDRAHWQRGHQHERLIIRDGGGGELRSELLRQGRPRPR